MHASVWFELFGGLLSCQNLWYMGGKCANKEGHLNWAHPFHMVLGLKRGSDITEVRVYLLIDTQMVTTKYNINMGAHIGYKLNNCIPEKWLSIPTLGSHMSSWLWLRWTLSLSLSLGPMSKSMRGNCYIIQMYLSLTCPRQKHIPCMFVVDSS